MGKLKVNPGDLVRVVAPAGKGTAQNLPLISKYIESLELVPQITDNIYNQDEPFYSNFDEFRANDLISAVLNDNCKVIWCIRGGSGCNRLIEYLEERLPIEPPTPKLLIGYSDITVLHIYFQNKYNWQSIHGAMLEAIVNGSYDQSSETVVSLVSLIFHSVSSICYPSLTRLDAGEPLSDPISAPLIGGNLTLVEASIGTLWEIDTKDKILIIEDVSVAAYSIERSLEHLKQAGIFSNVRAVIFGDFTDADSQQLVQFVQRRFASDPKILCPVFSLAGIGHGRVNLPLPLNTHAEIKLDQVYLLCDSATS